MMPPLLDPRPAAGSLSAVFSAQTPLRLLLLLLLGMGAVTKSLRAALTEEQKKALFRKNHSSSTGSSKAKSASKSSSSKSSASKKKGSRTTEASSSKTAKKNSGSSGKRSGSSRKKSSSSPVSSATATSSGNNGSSGGSGGSGPSGATPPAGEHPAQTQSSAVGDRPPSPSSPATSLPLPHGAVPSAPITIEKSGAEPDQGMEPVPAPPPAKESFWSRIFGSHRTYAYLSASTRAAIDRAPVRRGRWKYIVIHNSGTREGNARVFDIYHKRVRHMQNGLAYHFVIGDGHGSGDGQVEVGPRWTKQINGGHVASDYLNDIALGICLVGDFNRDQPTKAQIAALEELVAYLRERVGKSQGRRAIVHAHKEINPRPTDCPGDRFPYGWLHAKFGNPR